MDRYEQISVVGEGSYGLVMKCRHKDTDQIVAIKKFLETEEDAAVRRMALREIRMLKKLRHENLVTMIEVFRHRKRFYLVFEFLDGTVLDELEKTPGGLGDEQSRDRIFQVLRAIQYCHSNQIIHRDIKPENVLVSSLGIVKLCDFGFARMIGINGEPCTEYVATRWYRAPELLVSEQQYGFAVDIWAIGCLFAEMMTGDPLFPGESDIDQLFLIVKMLGKPCLRHQQAMSRSSQLRGIMRSAAMDSTGLYREYPTWPLLALDFLSAAVRMDPSTRPSAEELLAHNYFTHDKFPSRFLPEVRERVNKEFGDNPLLRRYRVEILMSTDKKDEAIRQQQQAQRRSTQADVQRWRFNLLEGSIKRKYSYETNNLESSNKPPDPRGQKLNFIRREAQVNVNPAYRNPSQASRKLEITKDVLEDVPVCCSKESSQLNEIQKLERSLESLAKLGSKRSSSAQNELDISREPSPPLFQSLQSLQPQIQEEPTQPVQKTSTSLSNTVPLRDSTSNKDFQTTNTLNSINNIIGNNGNVCQTLQPSIHNISFDKFGKGNEFVKKSSPNLLQSIQTTRGLNHTNIPMLTPQPRGSQLFLKRLDRNVAVDTIQQPNLTQVQSIFSQPAGEPAASFGGGTQQSQQWGSIYTQQQQQHMHRKSMRENFVGSIVSTSSGLFPGDGSVVTKSMTAASVVGVLTGKLPSKNSTSTTETTGDTGFSLPMLPGATNTPKKRLPFLNSSLTLQGITPEVRYKKAKRKYNAAEPIPP